ncbi:DUF11 domain-containing protein [bacterium]|nr:DUF11 domain-containing protein [bacterium]
MKSLGIMITVMCTAAAMLTAQAQPKLEITIQEKKINLTEAEKTGASIVYAPGDTIQYTVIAKNTGDAVMVKPVVVDPVPAGTAYIVDSAAGQNCRIVFSVNKGLQYAVWPVMVTASTAGGAKLEREATQEEVTHIKWLVQENIPAGGEKVMSFQVVVK